MVWENQKVIEVILEKCVFTSKFAKTVIMTKQEYIAYWKTAAEKDWEVVQNLFDKANYPHALFFAHLVLEKLLKAHF